MAWERDCLNHQVVGGGRCYEALKMEAAERDLDTGFQFVTGGRLVCEHGQGSSRGEPWTDHSYAVCGGV